MIQKQVKVLKSRRRHIIYNYIIVVIQLKIVLKSLYQ